MSRNADGSVTTPLQVGPLSLPLTPDARRRVDEFFATAVEGDWFVNIATTDNTVTYHAVKTERYRSPYHVRDIVPVVMQEIVQDRSSAA